MKLSASNIAWDSNDDELMYCKLNELGFDGLEIAPTRIFPNNPYDKLDEAKAFQTMLKSKFSLEISSMQSIWYGRNENIFNSAEERNVLLDYTRKAIEFAEVLECRNLVFGCPRNRTGGSQYPEIAKAFFYELGEYAHTHNTVLAMEANPTIYNTDYINFTNQAIDFVKEVNSEGFKINLDVGTMIENEEDISILKDNIDIINHVHISEPYLNQIQERKSHNTLGSYLKTGAYGRFVSLEMKKLGNINKVDKILLYMKNVFT